MYFRISCSSYFNPRPREGSDEIHASVIVVKGISIHAPVKGATLVAMESQDVHKVFQSTPP